MYAHMCICMHACMYVCMLCTYACMRVCMHACVHICIHACTGTLVHSYPPHVPPCDKTHECNNTLSLSSPNCDPSAQLAAQSKNAQYAARGM